jgi:hypothetical protein
MSIQEHSVIIHYSSVPNNGNSTDHHFNTFINDHELIFLTVHYDCGHDACRPVYRITASFDQLDGKRDIFSPARCKLCTLLQARALERRMEKHGGRL